MKFIILFIILLISFNIDANLIVKKKISGFSSCLEIKNKGNSKGNGNYTLKVNNEEEIVFCDMDSLNVYNWINDFGGSGIYRDYNDAKEFAAFNDDDNNTTTDKFSVTRGGSIVWSRIIPDRPLIKKKITVYWDDYVSSGYGNRMHLQVTYMDSGNNIKAFNNSYLYSNDSWTERSVTFEVTKATSIQIWMKDIAKGAPAFRWREILIQDINNN